MKVESVLIAASVLALNPSGKCETITYRKDWDTLTAAEKNVFTTTIKTAMATKVDPKDKNSISIWEEKAQFHNTLFKGIHGGGDFYPFHRLFLLETELMLKKINPKFSWPVFNAAKNSKNWFDTDFIKYSSTNFKTNRDIKREAIDGDFIFDEILEKSKHEGFAYWSMAAEEVHGSLHMNIQGDMKSHLSPRDVAFWVHHAGHDKKWHSAQLMFEKWGVDQYYAPVGPKPTYNRATNKDTKIIGYGNSKFSEVIDINSLCYSYNDPPIVVPTTTVAPTTTVKATTTTTVPVVATTVPVVKTTTVPVVDTTTVPVAGTTTIAVVVETTTVPVVETTTIAVVETTTIAVVDTTIVPVVETTTIAVVVETTTVPVVEASTIESETTPVSTTTEETCIGYNCPEVTTTTDVAMTTEDAYPIRIPIVNSDELTCGADLSAEWRVMNNLPENKVVDCQEVVTVIKEVGKLVVDIVVNENIISDNHKDVGPQTDLKELVRSDPILLSGAISRSNGLVAVLFGAAYFLL
jgi:hypothetical protein